jgi:hypothetical protein
MAAPANPATFRQKNARPPKRPGKVWSGSAEIIEMIPSADACVGTAAADDWVIRDKA